ncbi:MAG: 4Fe-4S binding protein [Sulfurovum sp.]|nr:4Fe-4S binding protein [Sulfurovum sp.]
MKLHFNVASCVRAMSKFSECTKCVDACPESIQITDNLPSFSKSTGVETAACLGACPTEAFSLSDFSVTEFFFTFIESKVRLISSKINVPCISVLSVEHLISLALACDKPITIDLNGYKEGSYLLEQIQTRIEEANFVLSSFCDKELSTNLDGSSRERVEKEDSPEKENSDVSSRRDFLSQASVKGVVKHKKTFDDAVEAEDLQVFKIDAFVIARMKDKNIPDKRKILFTTLKRADAPDIFEVLPEEEISFVSQKFIDESCTNCQICYRICPTGALSSNGKFSLINFDAMLCLKCHLCHDACEPDSIHLQSGFEVKEFFEATQRTLATFNIKRCNECGNNFTYTGGEQACPRCQTEEEEAMFLHDNAKLMKGDES